jgi:CubicO group peptidase (beta-lactamase class C family)
MEATIRRSVESGRIAGFQTLLARGGRLAHQGMGGYLDLASRKAMREDAIFRIFSMTKPITSLAVLMLHEKGCFQLDSPISRFIPELGDLRVQAEGEDGADDGAGRLETLARPVSIRDLLTHTSGLGYGIGAPGPLEARWRAADLLRTDEAIADKMPRIADLPLHHQPGLRYTYSFATDVLGRLVEIAGGLPLDEFFRTRIFEPLGMVDTGFFVPSAKLDRLASLYTQDAEGRLVDMASIDPATLPHFPKGAWVDKSEKPRFLSGGGGLVSTARDYLRFALMLRGGGELGAARILDRDTVKLMTTGCLGPGQFFIPGCNYGLGLTVVEEPERLHLPVSAGSYGGSGAATTDFWVDPEADLVGVFMVQLVSLEPVSVVQDFRVGAALAIEDRGSMMEAWT